MEQCCLHVALGEKVDSHVQQTCSEDRPSTIFTTNSNGRKCYICSIRANAVGNYGFAFYNVFAKMAKRRKLFTLNRFAQGRKGVQSMNIEQVCSGQKMCSNW